MPGAGELVEADAPLALYLEVELNGRPTGLIAAFEQRRDGTMAADLSELGEVGIAVDPALAGPDGKVALRAAGLGYDYDEAAQRIDITADTGTLATHRLALRGQREIPDLADPIWGGFANYNVFASGGRGHEDGEMIFNGISVAADAHLSGPLGVLSSGVIAGFLDDRGERAIRLDTTYAYSDPERLVTYRAGDVISGGLSWTRPVRLGGVQVERDFSLRPDLITRPLPAFSGTAEVPSTLEIYSDNVKVYSGEIEPGPFELTDIPVITDAGAAQVVLVDAQGRTVLAELPFFTSADLLRPGMLSFSAGGGWPRRSYGVESFDYAADPYATATVRYGVTDRLTVEAHAEGGEGLLDGGAGAAFSFGRTFLGSVHAAASQSGDGTGTQLGGSMQIDLGPTRIAGRSIRRFGDFRDIAAVSAPRLAHDEDGLSAAPPSAVDQLSLSTSLGFDPARLSVSYTRQQRADDRVTSTGSLSLSRSLWKGASISLSGFQDLEDTSNYGAYASVSFPLGGRRQSQAGARTGPDGATFFADVQSGAEVAPGETAWRLRAALGEEQRLEGEARHWTQFGALRAAVGVDPDRVRAEADLDGSLVIGGGGIYLSRRINDSFAIADAGASDVTVFYQNRPVGRTGASGRLVVPDLRGYETNRISIEPNDLPADVLIETDTREVAPRGGSGVYVGFGAGREEDSAILVLVDASGAPLPVGSEVVRSGAAEPALVGYDGETYLTGLSARETLEVRVSGGGRCTASVDAVPEAGLQTRIEGVICR